MRGELRSIAKAEKSVENELEIIDNYVELWYNETIEILYLQGTVRSISYWEVWIKVGKIRNSAF